MKKGMKITAVLLSIASMGAMFCACDSGTATTSNSTNSVVSTTESKASSTPSSQATTPSSTVSQNTSSSPSTTSLFGIWGMGYYVDDFNQPTNDWFVTQRGMLSGTFSNSATTNSKLTGNLIVDFEGDITFQLFEYGRHQVKNASESYVDTYSIVMRTPDNKDHKMTGTMYCGDDRIYIDDKYRSTVMQALEGTGDIKFHFTDDESSVTSYLLTVPTSNFKDIYKIVKGN